MATEIDFAQLAGWSEEQAHEKKSKVGTKGPRPWSTQLLSEVERACGFTYAASDAGSAARHWEFSVILDHAARRVCMAHSWGKRAEVNRRKFIKSLKRLEAVPQLARKWLDEFCQRRSDATGAIEHYRIRLGAVEGWKEIVAAWSRSKCKSEADRIAAARELQDSDQIDKFGDIQLFEAIAVDDAQVVWRDREGVSAEHPLLDYAAGTNAAFKMRNYKVPAYRHPDELRHPVFCDFGESRWSIAFAAHRRATQLESAENRLQRAEAAIQKITQKLASVKNEMKREAAQQELAQAQEKLTEACREQNWLIGGNGLRIKLWDGTSVREQDLTWASKRLQSDLPPVTNDRSHPIVVVARADRYGRAAAGAQADQQVQVDGLFDLKEWNGRLQAPRRELDEIADIRDGIKAIELTHSKRQARLEKLKRHIHWFITFSAKLTPHGPWPDFAEKHLDLGLNPDPQYWPHAIENKERSGRGRLLLARLPGLRALSVDLGHRYAAACAVWESVTARIVNEACDQAGILRPGPTDLFVFVPKNGKTGRTLFRRIGPDKLNGKNHPAPWARLDRSFVIRLQGEDQPARRARPEELAWRESLESKVGHIPDTENSPKASDLRMDQFFQEAVKIVRLAVRRHSDYARIADGLIVVNKSGMGNLKPVKLEGETLIGNLQEILVRWHGLKTSSRWRDEFATQKWNEFIQPLLTGIELPEVTKDMPGQQRKAIQKKLRDELEPVAKQLATMNRTKISIAWATEWRKNDSTLPQHIKSLRQHITPRGKKRNQSIRQVGGLSLTRIATFSELYQLQKAFYTRLQLSSQSGRIIEPRAIAERGFAQKLLDQRDAMRESRARQLASRIIEAALGIGSENKAQHWAENPQNGIKTLRPRARIDDPRFHPCQAVVIENLTRYRPDELMTRRENRQLMSWSSARIKKYLTEGCQLHGLHLREVQPAYTSRQDFRTGAPGMRCVDVTVAEFCKKFRRELKRAEDAPTPNALERYLRDLQAKYCQLRNGQLIPRASYEKHTLRIPRKGGEIFVSATETESKPDRKGPSGIQADLNAAGNIGLKALLDPDWPGTWWNLPATLDAEGYRVPHPEKTKGTPTLQSWRVGRTKAMYSQSGTPESTEEESDGKLSRRKKRPKDVINLWRDVSSKPLTEGDWRPYAAYEALVRWRVIQRLRKSMGLVQDSASGLD